MQAKSFIGYLIVNARGDMRIRKSAQVLERNEFAFRVVVTMPASYWASVCGQITVDLPTMETAPAIEVEVKA